MRGQLGAGSTGSNSPSVLVCLCCYEITVQCSTATGLKQLYVGSGITYFVVTGGGREDRVDTNVRQARDLSPKSPNKLLPR